MAWNMSAAKRRALVKLQLRDKNGRWIEMGRGVKWYSSKRKKEIGGTVVGSQGEYALVRLNKENPTHEPALVKVPARHIEVVSNKATLSDSDAPSDAPKSNLDTPEFEAPEEVGRKQSNAFVKPSDSPEDYSISETPDGNTYISRKDGAQLYFPARSLDVGDELIAPDGADESKPFSMGKAWAKKGAERLNTAGPKTGKVVSIEGDRYAIVQLPEGHTVDDKKNPGEQTDKVTVGLSNSVIKLTPGLKEALGNKLEDNFADTSQDDGGEEEIDPNSPDAQSDHIGREVTDEQLAEEDDSEDLQDDAPSVEDEDEDAPIVEEEDPAAKAAAEADLARRVAEREAKRKELGDQYDENGLTDDENKMITAYERMANRAADKFDDDGSAKFFAKAEDIRATGKRRLGATKEEAADEVKAESAPQTPEKAPESAPEPEKAPEVTPEAAKPAEANVPLAELEQQAKAEGDLVLYHGGLPEGTTLDGIDLNRSGTQQNKRGATYGGFYLTDESSKKWSEDYAEKRNGVMHGFAIDKNARIDDRGTQQIDRISAEARAIAAEKADIIKGKDLLGRTQYVILNKDVVKGVGETNLKDKAPEADPEPTTPKLVEPTDEPTPEEEGPLDARGRTQAEVARATSIRAEMAEAVRNKDGDAFDRLQAEQDAINKKASDRVTRNREAVEPVDTSAAADGSYTRGFQWQSKETLDKLPDGTVLMAPARSNDPGFKDSILSPVVVKKGGKWISQDRKEKGSAEIVDREITDPGQLKGYGVWSTPHFSGDFEPFDGNLNGITAGDKLLFDDGSQGVFSPRKNGNAAVVKDGRHSNLKNASDIVGVHRTSQSEDSVPTPAPEATAKPELPPLVEGEELELPIPGVKKQGKRTDKSAQHLKTLEALEEGDRVSYTNAHDETSTYQKHADGTWDLLDPEDEHEDLSPLEEAISASDLANRHKRGDLEVSTVADQEEALKEERYKNTDEQGRDYFDRNPDPKRNPKVAENRDLPKVPTRAEQDKVEANLADKPWSAEDIASNMRDWFDMAQAVKDGDNRAIETMANNKRAGDEETFIAVNDKGQPFDVTLTYNGLGDPVVRISNFENSNEDYGDFEIDTSVMP
jgi:hypothetical protein